MWRKEGWPSDGAGKDSGAERTPQHARIGLDEWKVMRCGERKGGNVAVRGRKAERTTDTTTRKVGMREGGIAIAAFQLLVHALRDHVPVGEGHELGHDVDQVVSGDARDQPRSAPLRIRLHVAPACG